MTLRPGFKLGPYEIVESIGAGGMRAACTDARRICRAQESGVSGREGIYCAATGGWKKVLWLISGGESGKEILGLEPADVMVRWSLLITRVAVTAGKRQV